MESSSEEEFMLCEEEIPGTENQLPPLPTDEKLMLILRAALPLLGEQKVDEVLQALISVAKSLQSYDSNHRLESLFTFPNDRSHDEHQFRQNRQNLTVADSDDYEEDSYHMSVHEQSPAHNFKLDITADRLDHHAEPAMLTERHHRLQGVSEILECQYGLLFNLLCNEVLTETQLGEIRAKRTAPKQNNKLIQIMQSLLFDDSKCDNFCASLHETGQSHVANYISGNADPLDRLLTKAERSKIAANYRYIADHIKIEETNLLFELESLNAITKQHLQFLENIQVEFEKIEDLVAIVRRRSLKQYQHFKLCLRKTRQNDIADILEKPGVVQPVDVHMTKEQEQHIVDKHDSLSEGQKRELYCKTEKRLPSDIKLVDLQGGHSIRLYFLCQSHKALLTIGRLQESGELQSVFELFFNSLLKDSSVTVNQQQSSLVDYHLCEKFFIDNTSVMVTTASVSCTETSQKIAQKTAAGCSLQNSTNTSPDTAFSVNFSLQHDHRIRIYLLCQTVQSLHALRKLQESGELTSIIELLFKSLLSDFPVSVYPQHIVPVYPQLIYLVEVDLVDYWKSEQYFFDHSETDVVSKTSPMARKLSFTSFLNTLPADPSFADPKWCSSITASPPSVSVTPQGHLEPSSAFTDANRSIFITGFPADIAAEDQLHLFFEGMFKATVCTAKVDFEKRTAKLTLEKQEVAQDLISKKFFHWHGVDVLVSKQDEEQQLIPPAACPNSAGTNICDVHKEERFNTIKISNITPAVANVIEAYFKNATRSGGGKFHGTIRMNSNKGTARITFKDPDVALRVVKKPEHVISEVKLKVVPCECYLEDADSQAVCMEGITPTKLTPDILKLTFRQREYGGRPFKDDIFIDDASSRAVVTFHQSQDAGNFVSKFLQKKGEKVNVHILAPRSPPPMIIGNVDERRLLVKHLPAKATFETLKLFIEINTNSEVKNWIVCKKPGRCVLEFSILSGVQPSQKDAEMFVSMRISHLSVDYRDLRRLVCRLPYQGSMISIQRVPETSTIQVHFNNPDWNEEILKLYFKDDLHGGPVANVDVKTENGCAIIEFESRATATKVTAQKSHTLNNETFRVMEFFPWIGKVARLQHKFKYTSQMSLLVDIFPTKLKELENELRAINCVVEWPKAGGETVTMQIIDENKILDDWGEKAVQLVGKYASDLKHKRLEIEGKIWPELKVMVAEMLCKSSQELSVFYDDDHTIVLTGKVKDVDEFVVILEKIKSDIKRNLELHQEVMQLKSYELEILDICQSLFPIEVLHSIKITVDADRITLIGLQNKNQDAKAQILNVLKQLKCSKTLIETLPQPQVTLKRLAEEKVKRHLSECFRSCNLCASWTVDHGLLIVSAFAEEDITKALDIINNEVAKEQVIADMKLTKLNESVENKLSSSVRYNPVSIQSAKPGEDFYDVLAATLPRIEFIPMEFGYVDLIARYHEAELSRMKTVLGREGGTVFYQFQGTSECGFQLSGTEEALHKARAELCGIADCITSADCEIDLFPPYFQTQQGKAALVELGKIHHVSIQQNGTVADQLSSNVLRSKIPIGEGRNVSLVNGDITKFSVAVIVTQATARLQHTGGISKAISDAGGNTVAVECKSYISNNAPLLPGQLYVTKPGYLPCQHLIHVVIPQWRGGNRNERQQLISAIHSSLEAVGSRMAIAVALPVITYESMQSSTASLTTPLLNDEEKDGCKIMCSSVVEFLNKNPKCSLREIFIIDADVKVLDFVKDAINESKATAGSLSSTLGSAGSYLKRTFDPSVITTIQGMQISLKKISIVTLPVDVIVNTSNSSLDLKSGAVATSILRVAGSEIQAACFKSRPPGFTPGDLVATSGYSLPCKEVYHGFLISWDQGSKQCEEVLRRFMRNILKQATVDRWKSIAIPALGTGNLNYPYDLVAAIMYEEVAFFAQRDAITTITDIIFVAYDQEVIKVFEAKIKELSSTVAEPRSTTPQAFEKRDASGQSEKCLLRICGFSGESVRAAVKEIQKLIDKPLPESSSHLLETEPPKASFRKEYPSCWNWMGEKEFVKVVRLSADSPEYIDVENRARATARGAINTIVQIDRIQNLTLYKQYTVIKEVKGRMNQWSADFERTLWHGTDIVSVNEINERGFNRSYAGKNAANYGYGVYLAVNFSYSAQNAYSKPDDDGIKRVYQCKAFIGEYTRGESDIKEPPRKQPPSTERYDSVVDNPAEPTMFIVFNDPQVYPEYLIYFR